jgi:hypothetical protein
MWTLSDPPAQGCMILECGKPSDAPWTRSSNRRMAVGYVCGRSPSIQTFRCCVDKYSEHGVSMRHMMILLPISNAPVLRHPTDCLTNGSARIGAALNTTPSPASASFRRLSATRRR